MDLQFKRTVYKVNLYGEEYEMRKPTVREIVDFQKSVKALSDDEERIDGLTKFFVSLGLSNECIYQMQADHMMQLLEHLSSIDKKK